MADPAHDARLDGGRLAVLQWEMRERPEHDRNGQDHGPGAAEEDLRAIDEAERQAAGGRPAVGRHLENERRRCAPEDRGFEQSRRDDGCREADHIESDHRCGLGAEERAEHAALRGNEGRNDQGVNGQTRRAGHERGDENGRDPVPLAFDRAGGHDGGNGAGVSGEQRDERFSLQSDARHRAIGDQGRAREVARVLEDADKQEQDEDLGQEDHDRADARPDAFDQQRPEDRVREQRGDHAPRPVDSGLDPIHQRHGGGEDALEDGDDHERKNQRSGQRVQEDGVEPAGPMRGGGRMISGAVADARGPFAALRNIVQDRKLEQGFLGSGRPVQKIHYCGYAVAARGAD